MLIFRVWESCSDMPIVGRKSDPLLLDPPPLSFFPSQPPHRNSQPVRNAGLWKRLCVTSSSVPDGLVLLCWTMSSPLLVSRRSWRAGWGGTWRSALALSSYLMRWRGCLQASLMSWSPSWVHPMLCLAPTTARPSTSSLGRHIRTKTFTHCKLCQQNTVKWLKCYWSLALKQHHSKTS